MPTYLVVILIFVRIKCLRGHIVCGATAYISFDASVVQLDLASNPKVNETQAQTSAYKVLRLQVIVDHLCIMNHLKRQTHVIVLPKKPI